MTGTLILVVGPSGSGKDTLLLAARRHFADRADVIFPKRHITREADAGGEDHIAISQDTFDTMVSDGEFALNWTAHNLSYGVTRDIEDVLQRGHNVVVNVSRGVLDIARDRYENVRILSLFVNAKELERRLRARGREDDDDIKNRLKRAAAYSIDGTDVVKIDNSDNL